DTDSYLPFGRASGGGVTVSGGDPLIQTKFITELFKELKKLGVHTAIDTSGGCYSKSPSFRKYLDELLPLTDLVLMDLKQINPERHKTLTGLQNEHVLDNAKSISKKQLPIWVRHVLVTDITVVVEDLSNLAVLILS